jgi:hypothetical protein
MTWRHSTNESDTLQSLKWHNDTDQNRTGGAPLKLARGAETRAARSQ